MILGSIDTGGGLVGRGQMNYTYLYTLLWSKPKREFLKKLVILFFRAK